MKKYVISAMATLSAVLLLTGCIGLSIGGGSKPAPPPPPAPKATVGQQLVDLQKAKDSGAINDTEFQVEKAKLLKNN